MIYRQVVFSQLEVLQDGTLQLRLDKQVVDGESVLSHEYHRTSIPPGTSVDMQMDAVEVHLAQMGWPAVGDQARARVLRVAAVEHSPEKVRAYRARVAQVSNAR